MMSDETSLNSNISGGENSPKRRNQSFVKNVATKVTNLIPKSISNWFKTGGKRSNTNGSVVVHDGHETSDYSSDEECLNFEQPPRKKICLQPLDDSRNDVTQTNMVSNPCKVQNNRDASEYDSMSPKPSTSGSKLFRKFDGNMKQSGGDSSSTLPSKHKPFFFPRKDSVIKNNVTSNNMTNTSLLSTSLPSPSIADSTKPLLPSFAPGSPFYTGKTMYGGASAHYLNNSIFHKANIVVRKRPIVTPSASKDCNTLSTEAQRILEVLDNCSSPLTEVRRLQSITKNLNADKTFAPNHSSFAQHSNFLDDLCVSSVPTLLSIKRAKLMDSTNAARQIAASRSSSLAMPYPKASKQSVKTLPSKIKTVKWLKQHRVKQPKPDEEILPPLELPKSNLVIDHTNMPKITFSDLKSKVKESINMANEITETPVKSKILIPMNNDSSKDQSSSVIMETNDIDCDNVNLAEQSSKNISSANNQFTLSVPVCISTVQLAETQAYNFKFSLPQNCSSKCLKTCETENSYNNSNTNSDDLYKHLNNNNVYTLKENSDNENTLKGLDSDTKWLCKTCMILNDQNEHSCFCCQTTKPGVNLSNSPPKSTVEPIKSFADILKNQSSKWECNSCLTRNEAQLAKCACCGENNSSLNKEIDLGFSKIVKEQAAKWECISCMTRNDDAKDKCVCCGASNPNPKTTNDSAFAKIVNVQASKWECTSCLTRNDNSAEKCVCCESPKPSAVGFTSDQNSKHKCERCLDGPCKCSSEPARVEIKKAPLGETMKFSFGIPTSKSLEVPKGIVLDNKILEPKPGTLASGDSGTPKPTFSFGISSGTNVSDVKSKDEAQDPQKSIFTFGLSKKNENSQSSSATTILTSTISSKSAAPEHSIFSKPITTITSTSVEPSKIFTGNCLESESNGVSKPSTLPTDVPQTINSFNFHPPASGDSMESSPVKAAPENSLPGANTSLAVTLDTATVAPASTGTLTTATTNIITTTQDSSLFGPFNPIARKDNNLPSPFFSFANTPAVQKENTPKFNFSSNKTSGDSSIFTFGGKNVSNEPKSEAPVVFGAQNTAVPAFGSTNDSTKQLFGTNSVPAFGATNSAPVFNSSLSRDTSLFGLQSHNAAPEIKSSTLFGGVGAGQPPPYFGSKSDAVPAFGATAPVQANPTFALPTQQPAFEIPQVNAQSPPPAFNFGAQPSAAFAFPPFAQQQNVQQGAQSGPMFSFGGQPPASSAAPNMQFSIGTFPGASQAVMANRKVRKAHRRTPR